MRILYVINGFDPGGAEHGLLTLIDSGVFDGHELRVLAFCRGRGTLADKIVARLGDRIWFVSDRESLTLWACVVGFVQILVAVRRFHTEKLVLSLKQANVVGRLAAIFTPSLTCVAFEHIAEYRSRRLQGLYGPLLRVLSWRVDEIWADCAETLKQTRDYFSSRYRATHVVPLFVAEPGRPAKATYPLSSPVRVVAAGRLVARKNTARAVDAVTRLCEDGVAVTLDVYGDGPDRRQIEALIARRNYRDRVTLHRHRADWIADAIHADIFLNLSETEGFCIVVAEAMTAGLPVIAVDVGGVRDYGRDGENMLKLAAPDVKAASAAILRLVGDASLRERLGRRGRADMLNGYDAASCRRLTVEALSSSSKRKVVT